jgi:hypothetical protein
MTNSEAETAGKTALSRYCRLVGALVMGGGI